MLQTENQHNTQKRDVNSEDIIVLIILFFYLLVDFVPQFEAFSIAEPQWIYLNVLNFAVTAYIFYEKTILEDFKLKDFFGHKVALVYSILIFLSGISMFFGINYYEGILTWSRYLISFVSFINLYVLFRNKTHLFKYIAFLITGLLFIQCFQGLTKFYNGYNNTIYTTLANITTCGHANKNIFSANILVKIPFVMYCVLEFQSWKKTASAIILFLAILLLFLLGARALMIGFILMSIVCLVLLNTNKKSGKILNLRFFNTTLVICLFITTLLSIIIIKNGIYKEDSGLDRFKNISLEESSMKARLNFWESSIDLIAKKPILGCGLGNWKVESLYYEYKYKDKSNNGVYMHNDYLEVTAESGILAGILYLFLFAIIAFLNLKNCIKTQSSEKKIIHIIILTSFLGYAIDSFFNFPLNRPTMQVVFVLFLILTIIFNSKEKKIENNEPKQPKHNNNLSKLILIPMLLLSLVNLYPNILSYKNSIVLNMMENDKEKLNLKFENLNSKLNYFPNLDGSGIPIADLKTRYLINEKRFDEALQQIKISKINNPYSPVSDDLTGLLYIKLKEKDSVKKYYKNLHYKCPNHKDFYSKYMYALYLKKDTATILKTFKNLKNKSKSGQHFYSTYLQLSNSGYDFYKSFNFINQGYKKFPKDTLLIKVLNDYKNNKIQLKTEKRVVPVSVQKNLNPNVFTKNDYIIKSNEFTNKGQYKQALEYCLKAYKMDKNDIIVLENLGLTYFNLHQFENTLKYLNIVLESKKNPSGKIELVAAACHFNLKNKQKACELAKIALSKNYPDSKKYTTQFCN